MPAKLPETSTAAAGDLVEIGKRIRARRKSLHVSATATAESAGMSRVTLHRIERGEPSVTIGAYLNAMNALGMKLAVSDRVQADSYQSVEGTKGWLPARIDLNRYPQLKQLAWQVKGIDELKPEEALDIYERNWRHVDPAALEPHEQNLIDALRQAFGERSRDV